MAGHTVFVQINMRIALFGGTFDPIHRGHLAIAKAAADAFRLDTVLFAPVGVQPLKLDATPTCFADRLAMATLACALDPRFAVTNLDAPNPDRAPNYTIDTIALLQTQMPGSILFVLVGADSFLNLRRWHQPDRLLTSADWIVVSRPGFSLDDLSPLNLTPAEQTRVHLLNGVHEDVSATDLRHRLHHGDPCDDLLPPNVLDYIRQHHLY
jgi:nicotinate-nucleotide adenylyltransferase